MDDHTMISSSEAKRYGITDPLCLAGSHLDVKDVVEDHGAEIWTYRACNRPQSPHQSGHFISGPVITKNPNLVK